MGHYASEMSSTWEESISWTRSLMKLREKLRGLPLSDFSTDDIGPLFKLFTDAHALTREEVLQLENKVRT